MQRETTVDEEYDDVACTLSTAGAMHACKHESHNGELCSRCAVDTSCAAGIRHKGDLVQALQRQSNQLGDLASSL